MALTLDQIAYRFAQLLSLPPETRLPSLRREETTSLALSLKPNV